jgi:hypothetical protein
MIAPADPATGSETANDRAVAPPPLPEKNEDYTRNDGKPEQRSADPEPPAFMGWHDLREIPGT